MSEYKFPLPLFNHRNMKRNQKVINNYSVYEQLVSKMKYIEIDKIYLSENINIRKYTKEVDATISENHLPIKLYVEVCIKNKNNFKFKLFSRQFMNEPYFRYDSIGATHRNRLPGVNIRKQRVSTPHFHKYDNEGRVIAFKTPELNDQNLSEQLKDPVNCFYHFCDTANVKAKDNTCIDLSISTFVQPEVQEDPLLNIDFQ